MHRFSPFSPFMITWLQTFFLKHNKWLFGALLIVIIVTFVLTIGPQSIFDGGRQIRAEQQMFYGYNLFSERDQRRMGLHAEVSAQLRPDLGFRGEAITQYAFMRVRALALANELGIPRPTSRELERFIQQLPAFQDEEGNFDPGAYTMFLDLYRTRLGLTDATLSAVLREDFRIQQVVDSLAGPGFLVPFEARENIREEKTVFTTRLLRLAYADFSPEVSVEDDAVRSFFDGNPARYAVPERLALSAVHFRSDAFVDRVTETPTQEDLERTFQRNRFRYDPNMFRQPEEGEEPRPEVTLDDVREEVIRDWKRSRAQRFAEEASEEFIIYVHTNRIERGSAALQAAIERSGGEVRQLTPFARGGELPDRTLPAAFFNSMWIYTTGDRFFSDPTQSRDGAVVLLLDEVLPSRQPDFEEVQGQVAEDFRRQERRTLFSEFANESRRALQDRVRAGADLVEAATELGFSVEEAETFEGGEVPWTLQSDRLWDRTRFLEPGQISNLTIRRDDALFVYMVDRSTPEIDWESEEIVALISENRDVSRRFAGWLLLREMTDRSLQAIDAMGV